jgi:uncharacterized protein (DUF1501 family)
MAMKHTHSTHRRHFLKLSASLAALGLMGLELGAPRTARAAQADDYKALVCVYLFGGNDGNNMIVPLDASRYVAYQNLRGSLALGGNKLLPAITDANGAPYALHYGLPEMNALFGAGRLAVVLNTGMLQQPLTRAQYLQGLNAPSNLFSHSDQIVQAQTGQPTALGTGWGGRLLDEMGAGQDNLAAISTASPALLLQGTGVRGNVVTPGVNLALSGLSLWPQSAATARRQALNQMLGLNSGSPVRHAANQAFADGLQLADALQSNANLGALSTVFPGTSIGNQLKEVMRLIRLRAQQGPGRQVFFCAWDGFDTHSSQDWQHWDLLAKLSQALDAFYHATQEAGLGQQVTTFTQSEFGRTLQSNGSGSDHAWGNHQLVLGGAVQGGIYGAFPELALNGPDDANGRGVWIPKISTAQFGAELGRWFGASEAELAQVFPNLGLFPNTPIGFMA